METVDNEVLQIISKQLKTKPEKLLLNHNLSVDLGADSLDAIEIIVSLEEQFDVEISDNEAENIKTISDVISLIKNKK